MVKLLSVNVGQPRLNPWKEMKLTGIDKRPVDGPVMVWGAPNLPDCGPPVRSIRKGLGVNGRQEKELHA